MFLAPGIVAPDIVAGQAVATSTWPPPLSLWP
jgi:hypothetical protein